ncbi:hypothetical protein L7F22_000805 [Adiantum nelumboides]|nr:hypothetical protein [Adiantum nelumboides]
MLSKQKAFLSSALSLFTQANQRSVLSWNSLLAAYGRHGVQGLLVLHLFQDMQQQGVLPNRVSFILTLSSLLNHPSNAICGKRIHACIQACSFRSHVILATSLFNMYGRCGSLEAAWNVFIDIPTKDIGAWNAMLSLYADCDLYEETLNLFVALLNEGSVVPNSVTFINVLGACPLQADICSGRLVHSLIAESMLETDVVVTTSLLNMYGKCGSLQDSCKIFSSMAVRNVITWNTMISNLTQNSQSDRALEVYHQMQIEGVLQDNTTLVNVFAGCTSQDKLVEGEWLLARAFSCHLKLNVTVGNAVLNMYGKCNRLAKVSMTLNAMEEKNLCTWTTMITAYTQSNHCKLALDYYHWMLQAGEYPNQVTFISVLDACASSRNFEEGKLVHVQIIDNGCDGERPIQNSLISMYGKCCSLQDALDIFNRMPKPDIFSWNSIISASKWHENGVKALGLFTQMSTGSISPNMFTFVIMCDVCSSQFAIDEGKHVHAIVIECGLEIEVIVGTSLINMYSTFSMLQDAQKAFNLILEHNVISWTALITAYARHKQGKEALQLFYTMQVKGIKPNNVTFTSILASVSSEETVLDAQQLCHHILNSGLGSDITLGNTVVTLYGKCGNIEGARMAFDKMKERDIVSWNAMVAVYAQHCSLHDVSLFLDQMAWEGFTPDNVTFLSVIHACSRQLAVFEGKQFHCRILESGFLKDSVVATAIMSFYGKCGSVNDALIVFNNTHQRDVVSWTVAILAYAQNGQAKEAMQLFNQMQEDGVTPNEITFSNVINTCSHGGLFNDGIECFTSMVKIYNLSPEVNHYTSIIELLGRAGQIHQADNLIGDMPLKTVPYNHEMFLQGEQVAEQTV